MRAPRDEASQLQRPLPNTMLRIVASGEREEPPSDVTIIPLMDRVQAVVSLGKAGADFMDPKELAKLYAAQMAKEAADKAAEKAADVAAAKARESAAADAENALNDVAIPYLKQIKSAMAGNFTFDVQRDVTSNRTLGVKFEGKERHPVSIKLIGGAIQVRIHTGGGMIYPEIKVPSDLSEEKLGALVQTIIEG